jgi:hypothetical protein
MATLLRWRTHSARTEIGSATQTPLWYLTTSPQDLPTTTILLFLQTVLNHQL